MQEIQFLEFMGGSNSMHAHSNYLICMHFFFQINAVYSIQLPMYTVAKSKSEELAVVRLKKTTLVEMLCIINLHLQ